MYVCMCVCVCVVCVSKTNNEKLKENIEQILNAALFGIGL